MNPTVFWFRRDLRLADNPALSEAARNGSVAGLFIDDPSLRKYSGRNRLAFLESSLEQLNRSMGGSLIRRAGPPAKVLANLAAEVGANEIFATADFGPYGRLRDAEVSLLGSADDHLSTKALKVHFVDSPYAVRPGSIMTGGGTPYKVFTPFFRAWKSLGWVEPRPQGEIAWLSDIPSHEVALVEATAPLPPPGEDAANRQLKQFLDGPVSNYEDARDRPGVDGTSGLSAYLKWGILHPRQILDRLGDSRSEDVFRSEICWREFYADVLWHRPDSARSAFVPKMSGMEVDVGNVADVRFEAWSQGKTGYPIVDAGMRQLLATGWMHNRVRMIVASFLVKDLHLDWRRGASWFMAHLVDGDLASNNHGWQWVAGTGTDASPYFRVFNPTTQSKKFDPDGTYIRRWVPELADAPRSSIHEPSVGGSELFSSSYELPIVDHRVERLESLARYDALKATW